MSTKVIRKWIQTQWSEDGALRAVDVPYSEAKSVKRRIDDIKDATDSSIRVEELTIAPTTENGFGKLWVNNNEMYFLDEYGNQIQLTDNGRIKSVTTTKVENVTEYFILSASDIANKYVKLLKKPTPFNATELSILGGQTRRYSVDYAVYELGDEFNITWNADSTNAAISVGLVSTLLEGDVLKVNYLSNEQEQLDTVEKRVEDFNLASNDIANAYVTLANETDAPESVVLYISVGGVYVQYGLDFVCKQSPTGEYTIVSWSSLDTTTGLQGILSVADNIKVTYTLADKTQLQTSKKQVAYYTLTSGDIANKFIDLLNTPVPIDAVECNIIGGVETRYGEDFIIKQDNDFQLRRLTWATLDAVTGMEGVLIAGDILQVAYMDGVGLMGAIRISKNDIAPSFLSDKIIAGSNISIAVNNNGGNETLTISGAAGLDKEVEYLTLDSTDVANQYIDLIDSPINANEAELSIVGGLEQTYNVEYVVKTDGVDIKRVSWAAADCPLGNGMTELISTDVLKISYLRSV